MTLLFDIYGSILPCYSCNMCVIINIISNVIVIYRLNVSICPIYTIVYTLYTIIYTCKVYTM